MSAFLLKDVCQDVGLQEYKNRNLTKLTDEQLDELGEISTYVQKHLWISYTYQTKTLLTYIYFWLDAQHLTYKHSAQDCIAS